MAAALLLPLAAAAQQPSARLSLADPALVNARAAFDGQRWAEADAQLRPFLATHPNEAEALYLLARTLFHEDKPRDSLDIFTRAARSSRPTPLDLRYVALDYVLLNDYPDADRWITRSAQDGPSDGETWYALGRIRYTENRFAEAAASFGKALALMPRSVKAENNLGLTYEALNRVDDAIKAYRQALAWQADAPHPSEQPMINLGLLLTDRNELDEALPVLLRAEAIAPEDKRVHSALGRLYVRRNELSSAQTELEKAVAADPKNSGLHFQLGQVYRKQGAPDRATAELKLAAELEQEQRTK